MVCLSSCLDRDFEDIVSCPPFCCCVGEGFIDVVVVAVTAGSFVVVVICSASVVVVVVAYYTHHYQSIGLGNRTVCYMKRHDNFVRIYQSEIATRGNHSGFHV